MPLEAMFAAPDFQIEGAYFRMSDGAKVVRCMVEAAALEQTPEARAGATLADVFREHERRIKRIASRKYDRGALQHGIVTVTRDDLAGEDPS